MQGAELGLRLRDRGAGFEPRDDKHAKVLLQAWVAGQQQRPDLRFSRVEGEPGRHHAQYRAGPVIEELMLCPAIDVAPPSGPFQNLSLNTTAQPPRRSSCVNVRPSCAATPSVAKKSAVAGIVK